MDTTTMTNAELDSRIEELEGFIRRNPNSSTLEKEILQELKQEKRNPKRKKDNKHEDILY